MTSYEVSIEHPCEAITLLPEVLPDWDYMAGDSGIEIGIPNFELDPSSAANRCPSIQHSYSYSLLCGSIEKEWLELGTSLHKVTFETPIGVESAMISIKVL